MPFPMMNFFCIYLPDTKSFTNYMFDMDNQSRSTFKVYHMVVDISIVN